MIDPAKALPEGVWFFRRWFTWLVTLACLAGVGLVIHKLSEGEHLAGVAYGLIILCGVLATNYLVGPSAEHIVKLLQAAAILKKP